MGELTDFLVWLQRRFKKGVVSIQTVQVVTGEVLAYLEASEKEGDQK